MRKDSRAIGPDIGAVYLIEQGVTPARQERDLTNMARAGMNLVVLWPPVSRWDAPDGVGLAFDSVDRVMDICGRLGLRAVLELEGQNQAMQFAPDYLFEPDMMPRTSIKSQHWLNYYHPKVDALILEYCRAIAGHFKDHPALWGYDLFNEVEFHSTDPYTVAAFRQWLVEKYGDIRKLNHVWGRFYESFDQIRMDTLAHVYSQWSSLQPVLDFEDFRADSIVHFIKRWGNAVREVDPNHVLIADNLWSMTTFDTVALANDDWKVAGAVDVFGLSVYPQSWNVRLRRNPCALGQIYRGGICAAGGKPAMVSELQTHNQTALAVGSSVFDEIKLWTWQAFAHGISGMVYWKWNPFTRGRQVCSRGMTAQDGTPNDRARQASECARVLRDNAAAFGPRKIYDSGVGLLYCPTCDRFTGLITPDDKEQYRRSLAGWYRFLWERNINPAILKAGDLAMDYWRDIKLLVVPMLSMLSRNDAGLLRNFAARGGKIVADGRFAIIDGNGFAYEHAPGGLVDLFGYEEVDYLAPNPDEQAACPARFSVVKLAGAAASAANVRGDVLAASNAATLYLATPFGLDTSNFRLASLVNEYLQRYVDRRCEVLVRGDEVDVTIARGANILVCATNYSDRPELVRVRVDTAGPVTSLWPAVQATVTADGNGSTLEFLVPRRDVAGFTIACKT